MVLKNLYHFKEKFNINDFKMYMSCGVTKKYKKIIHIFFFSYEYMWVETS